MSAPVLLDLSHTSHTRARTGIQRVTRSLRTALDGRAIPITHDPYARRWRRLEAWEEANLVSTAPATSRGAAWPFGARVRGNVRRIFGARTAQFGDLSTDPSSAIVVPEVFSPGVATALPALFGTVGGPRVAIFHDAIPLKFPELTPTKTVARFPAYLEELLAFDGIAAVSNDSRDALTDYWRWLGVRSAPPVTTLALGVDLPAAIDAATSGARPVVLCVGSIEARKNHIALLNACDELWARGANFELHLVGLAHPQTGRRALDRIRELQGRGRPLRYHGPATDAALDAAYAECAFTVYPSLIEGFGLPVIESVARGKPCICSGEGALGESAAGGGCVILREPSAPALSAAIDRLLRDPAEVAALSKAARARKFRAWSNYADELLAWIHTLSRRS